MKIADDTPLLPSRLLILARRGGSLRLVDHTACGPRMPLTVEDGINQQRPKLSHFVAPRGPINNRG